MSPRVGWWRSKSRSRRTCKSLSVQLSPFPGTGPVDPSRCVLPGLPRFLYVVSSERTFSGLGSGLTRPPLPGRVFGKGPLVSPKSRFRVGVGLQGTTWGPGTG